MIYRIAAIVRLLALTCSWPLSSAWSQTVFGSEIVSLSNEKCLDAAGQSITSGANVNQFRCNEGFNQRWTARYAGVPGYVVFENRTSGLCLDVRVGGANGGTLQQFTCHRRDNQQFRLEQMNDRGPRSGIRIVAKHSGQCLDVPGAVADDGRNIQQFPCHTGLNQRWVYADERQHRFEVSASPIGRHTLTLQEGRLYSFALGTLPAGVVPVMHLWNHAEARSVQPIGAPGPPIFPILSYQVPRGKTGLYSLLVHSPAGVAPGATVLTVSENNRRVDRRVGFPYGGVVIDVPDSLALTPYRYETVALPGRATDTFLLALDPLSRLTAIDDDGGLGARSRIVGAGTARIVVGTVNGSVGPTVLYADDSPFRDNDLDGIGYALEREIGTCDIRLSKPRCATVFNVQDTDRDGIEDGVEVLGVEDGALDFPAWGANPRHKDLFVEADWTSEFAATPLNEARIRRMQFHLARGPALHLDNPDGVDGIRLHVDAGIVPSDPADATLYGAWGDANLVTFWTPRGPPPNSFDPRRLPYFRQLLLVRGGGSTEFGRYWYATGEDPDTIMHEFGHALGLQHEGLVGGINCSPTYPSIMSYATPHASFLSGDGFPAAGINPSQLCEADGLGSGITDLSFITDSLGGIPVDSPGRRVDWNRDGAFSGSLPPGGASRCLTSELVRAVVNWGPSGCDAHVKGGIILSPEVATAGRTDGGSLLGASAMTRVGSRLYVFYIKGDVAGGGRLFYESAPIGTKASAGCTGGFRVHPDGTSDACMHFSGPFEIVPRLAGVPIGPSRIAALSSGIGVQLASVNSAGQILTFAMSAAELESNSPLRFVAAEGPLRGPLGAITTDSDLSLLNVVLDRVRFPGSGRHLALYYVDRAGALGWFSREIGTAQEFSDRGPVRNAAGSGLATVSGDSPALTSWTAVRSLEDLELFMVLQRADAAFRLYRYDRPVDRWLDITQTAFGTAAVGGAGHNQKIAFWFQNNLNGEGEIIERGTGFFSILYRHWDGADGMQTESTPSLWRSTNVSRREPPAQSLRFRTLQKFGHDWYAVRGNNYPPGLGAGFAVYLDEAMPALKLTLLKKQDNAALYDLLFLPFADGIFDMTMRPSPEFKAMEGTLCRAMRGDQFCGTRQQTKWGF